MSFYDAHIITNRAHLVVPKVVTFQRKDGSYFFRMGFRGTRFFYSETDDGLKCRLVAKIPHLVKGRTRIRFHQVDLVVPIDTDIKDAIMMTAESSEVVSSDRSEMAILRCMVRMIKEELVVYENVS